MNNICVKMRVKQKIRYLQYQKASLTVEAAFALPIFLYFMIALIYYIQIFTVQEQIQAAITKMGLNLSKSAYVMKDFPKINEAIDFDFSVFGKEFDIEFEQLTDELASEHVLKQYARKYLDSAQIINSCIKDGFDGISFRNSTLVGDKDYIDIVVNYRIDLPIKIFNLNDLTMLQRVRLRTWTGHEVEAAYHKVEEQTNSAMVFITETGSVYHKLENCSHIKLSITSVQGIPKGLKNEHGARYYPCESCCKGEHDENATYFITTDGTRYHSKRECSRIKRSVKQIPLTDIGERTPCKRCYK